MRRYPVPLPPPFRPSMCPASFLVTRSPAPSGTHFGFFKNGDEVLVVAEGDTFLSNYRLLHIGNDSADVEEISSQAARRASRWSSLRLAEAAGLGPGDPGSQ